MLDEDERPLSGTTLSFEAVDLTAVDFLLPVFLLPARDVLLEALTVFTTLTPFADFAKVDDFPDLFTEEALVRLLEDFTVAAFVLFL